MLELQQLEKTSWPARIKCWGARAASYVEMGNEAFDAAQRSFQRSLALCEQSGDSNGVNAALSNLVNVALANGAVADAVGHGTVLERRLDGTRHQRVLASTRLNLCAALLASEDIVESERVARLGWPAAIQFKFAYVWADNLALLAALQGRSRCAALLCGYGDAGYRAAEVTRETNEARIREQAQRVACVGLAAPTPASADFESLRLEGELLADNSIAAIAFSQADFSAGLHHGA